MADGGHEARAGGAKGAVGGEPELLIYSNVQRISHGPGEFVVDFYRLGPETPDLGQAPVLARVIINAVQFKGLYLAVQDQLRKYEQRVGEISAAPPEAGHEERVH